LFLAPKNLCTISAFSIRALVSTLDSEMMTIIMSLTSASLVANVSALFTKLLVRKSQNSMVKRRISIPSSIPIGLNLTRSSVVQIARKRSLVRDQCSTSEKVTRTRTSVSLIFWKRIRQPRKGRAAIRTQKLLVLCMRPEEVLMPMKFEERALERSVLLREKQAHLPSVMTAKRIVIAFVVKVPAKIVQTIVVVTVLAIEIVVADLHRHVAARVHHRDVHARLLGGALVHHLVGDLVRHFVDDQDLLHVVPLLEVCADRDLARVRLQEIAPHVVTATIAQHGSVLDIRTLSV
jgi:hypothetical protein